jgi:hypothetical protein
MLRLAMMALVVRLCSGSTGHWFFSGTLLPNTSLATVPVGYFGGNCKPRPEANLEMLSKMRVVCIEKWEGPCWNQCLTNQTQGSEGCSPSCNEERIMLGTLKSIKDRNAQVATLFYMNSFMDFQFYQLHGRMVDSAALLVDHDTNKSGTVTNDNGMKGITVFDLAKASARQLWLELVANLTASKHVDGIFIDKIDVLAGPNSGTSTGWAIQNRNKSSPIAITETHAKAYNTGKQQMLSALPPPLPLAWDVDVPAEAGAAAWNTTMAIIVIKKTLAKDPKQFPLTLQKQVHKTLSKFTYGFIQTDDQKTDHDPSDSASACSDDILAAFLLALEERVFLGCNGWDQRFSYALGSPTGPLQVQRDGSLLREFASGTNVTWRPGQPKGQMGKVMWATTPTPASSL